MTTQYHDATSEWLGERLAAQIRAAIDAIITIDHRGVVIEWNPAAERVFGYSAEEAIGVELGSLIIPDHMVQAHDDGMARYLATGEGPVLDQRLELPGKRKDGADITVELTITAFEAEGRKWFTGYARDITEIVEMRKQLELSERRFRTIVEGSSDVITILDGDGSWRYTSGAGTRIMGFEKGYEPEGGIFALVHPDDTEKAVGALAEIIAGERSETDAVELRLLDRHGRIHWFEATGVNMLDDPAVEGIVLHARDVTERREAANAIRVKTGQMAGLMGVLDMAVLVEDGSRQVVAANETFVRLFGVPVPADQLVGADCVAMLEQACEHFTDPAGFAARTNDSIAAGKVVRSDLFVTIDGRYLERDYIPVVDLGHVKGHIWMYRDVTEEREVQQQRETMLRLERQTRQQLEAQNERLLELDRLKSQLVATVSHELRTPLSSIVSFSDLLNEVGDDRPDDDQRFIHAIQRNAHRLLHLVDDLLLLARLESNAIALQLEPLSMEACLAERVESLLPQAGQKRISVETIANGDTTFTGDRSKVIQVVDNILSNAIKFTPEGGSVTVATAERDGMVEMSVTDTGIGIPEGDQKALFDRFFRASNAKKAMVPGTGLGLAVCRGLVELHGGSISLASRENLGTTVTVRFPREAHDA